MKRLAGLGLGLLAACGSAPDADLVLTNGAVYTFAWPDPAAPHDAAGWHPDGEAVAVRGGLIVYVGTAAGAERFIGDRTEVIDLAGATVLPGFIDSHTHNDSYGDRLSQVDLVGVATPEEAASRVEAWIRDRSIPPGAWVVGYGWDDGAWAGRYPSAEDLTRVAPEQAVVLRGLHGFAVWGNRLALERAGIDADTPDPSGGQILRDDRGRPTGVLKDRATVLLMGAVPPPDDTEFERRLVEAFDSMAASGIVQVGEANVDARYMAALQRLAESNRLPIRVEAWLATQGPNPDTTYLKEWIARGPDRSDTGRLVVRTAKAFYDGAMGSRGAYLLQDYSDHPGETGRGGDAYGFSRDWLARLAAAGFQLAIHSIGDRANRETLDFLDSLRQARPMSGHRIEHAQVVHPDDMPRFAALGVIASMQPIHAMDDMPWAEQRIGPERIRGAYAWRSLRMAGAQLVLSSDLPGADHHIFPGLHAAVTRTNGAGQPVGGWYPDQRLTPEEAVRGFTTWAARVQHRDEHTGSIAAGRWADLTVLDVDPLRLDPGEYDRILSGRVLYTIVGGAVAYRGSARPE